MIELLIDKKYSPSVTIDKQGKIVVKGELRAENPEDFFILLDAELGSKLDSLGLDKKDLLFVFFFDYLGSSNALALFTYVKKLEEEGNKMIWVYLPEDEDIEEIGEVIKVGYAPSISLMTADQYL